MPPKIVADVFETLGGTAKSAGQQVAADAKKMGDEALVELGIKPVPSPQEDDKKDTAQKDEQQKKIDQATMSRTAAKYKDILAQIKQAGDKRKQETQAYTKGPSGQKTETTIKQLEVSQQPGAQLSKDGSKEEEKKKLPPVNVQRERTKAERFRGASG